MTKYFGDETLPEKQLSITVLSFGFKYGIPVDSDLVFDVRFIPNPFYIPDLKPFSGLDTPVRDYVLNQEETKVFLEKGGRKVEANRLFSIMSLGVKQNDEVKVIVEGGDEEAASNKLSEFFNNNL